MNAKHLFAALAIATAGSAAMAVEATQFDGTPSVQSRDMVKAEVAQARHDGTLMSSGEATVFVDHAAATAMRSREEVRAEGRMAARAHTFDANYVGAM